MKMVETIFFQNPESLAIGVFIVLFAVTFSVLIRQTRLEKGICIFIALIVSLIAAWKLYSERFYDMEWLLAWVLILAVVGLLIKLFWPFVRHVRRSF